MVQQLILLHTYRKEKDKISSKASLTKNQIVQNANIYFSISNIRYFHHVVKNLYKIKEKLKTD